MSTNTPKSKKKALQGDTGDTKQLEITHPNRKAEASELRDAKQIETASANDDEIQLIAERVASLKDANWDVPISRNKPLTGKALQKWIERKEDELAKNIFERGIGYLLLKHELGHGAFEGYLKEQKISPRAARDAMSASNLLMNLSDPNRRRAAELPCRKLNVLTALPSPMIDDMFDGGDLDNAADMSRDQLRELVNLRKEISSQDKRLQRMSDTIERQERALQINDALSPVALHLAALRKATIDESERIRSCEYACRQILDAVRLNGSQEYMDTVAQPLMWNLQGMHASITTLYQEAFELLTHYKPDMDIQPPSIDEDELKRLTRLADEFANRAEQRAVMREMDVAAEQTRDKGQG